MTRITGAVLRDDTIQRLDCEGDNWYATVTADGTLYIALCDGSGYPGMRRAFHNSRLIRVEGHPASGVTFHDVPGYPDLSRSLRAPRPTDPPTRYYGFGTLAVDGTIYQFLSTWNTPTLAENYYTGNIRFMGAKLIYSPDGGATWHNQDGSTPVRWEGWGERDRRNMVFWDESGETFSLHSILQMGPGYSLNRDGYVYVYSPNGNTEGTMNQLVAFRVPKDRILDRSAYEFFVERNADGIARWSPRLADRGVVHTFPAGWVNLYAHPYAWQPSVIYNPALDVYLMANWATGPAESGDWFGKPSYLTLLHSSTPWGPWEAFHVDENWIPGGDQAARCYQPVIIPNWIADDGRSFWLVWTDFQEDAEAGAAGQAHIDAEPDLTDDEVAALKATLRPNYRFNVQLVELITE